ncbi:DUF3781 domain-containing protein [Pediococcus pentosaceus]|uniref:DUF3781 domain-containing protein n=1 Tax=Pediococcus pentosaceus TaxID=1255 RepID=UPI001330379B|nr:DUF3781 domain-containing protein [Pediococcus pentosaceus]KAF0465707.1 DUF3781 domain-containing protein [Pediococcus pentosaceus]
MNNEILKSTILDRLCYTTLVYQRINKKLDSVMDKLTIKNLITDCIKTADSISKNGKNYYVYNYKKNISVTINSNNFRVITVNRL